MHKTTTKTTRRKRGKRERDAPKSGAASQPYPPSSARLDASFLSPRPRPTVGYRAPLAHSSTHPSLGGSGGHEFTSSGGAGGSGKKEKGRRKSTRGMAKERKEEKDEKEEKERITSGEIPVTRQPILPALSPLGRPPSTQDHNGTTTPSSPYQMGLTSYGHSGHFQAWRSPRGGGSGAFRSPPPPLGGSGGVRSSGSGPRTEMASAPSTLSDPFGMEDVDGMMMGGRKAEELDDETAVMVIAEESDQFRRRAVELERRMEELTRKHKEVEEQNQRKIKQLQEEFERDKAEKSRSDPDGIRKMADFMQRVADDPSLIRRGGGDRGKKGRGKRAPGAGTGAGTGTGGSASTTTSKRMAPPSTDTLTMLSSQMISTLNGELESSQRLIEKKEEETKVLRSELQEIGRLLSSAFSSLQDKAKTVEEKDRIVESLRQKMLDHEQLCSSLQGKVKEREIELKEKVDHFERVLAERQHELESLLAERRDELESMARREKLCQEFQEKLEERERALNSKEKEYERRVMERTQQLAVLDEKVRIRSKELSRESEELEGIRTMRDELAEREREMSATLQEFETKVLEIERRGEEEEKDFLNGLEKRREVDLEILDEIQSQFKALERKEKELDKREAVLEKRVELQDVESRRNRVVLKKLQQTYTELKDRAIRLQKKDEKFHRALEARKQEMMDIEGAVSSRQKELVELQNLLSKKDDIQETISRLDDLLKVKRKELQALQDIESETYRSLERSTEMVSHDIYSKEKALDEILQTRMDELRSVEKKLNDKQDELKKFEKHLISRRQAALSQEPLPPLMAGSSSPEGSQRTRSTRIREILDGITEELENEDEMIRAEGKGSIRKTTGVDSREDRMSSSTSEQRGRRVSETPLSPGSSRRIRFQDEGDDEYSSFSAKDKATTGLKDPALRRELREVDDDDYDDDVHHGEGGKRGKRSSSTSASSMSTSASPVTTRSTPRRRGKENERDRFEFVEEEDLMDSIIAQEKSSSSARRSAAPTQPKAGAGSSSVSMGGSSSMSGNLEDELKIDEFLEKDGHLFDDLAGDDGDIADLERSIDAMLKEEIDH